MGVYAIVHLDMTTGRRTFLPERFPTPQEANERVLELSQASPGPSYLVQLVPAANA